MHNTHPTAIIHEGARLTDSVEVGPYTVVDGTVSIGAGTRIGSHCVIQGNTTIGEGCRVFTGAVIGSIPQDLKYKGEKSALIIGNNNIIREYVTINPGTGRGGVTRIGDNNLLMAYVHVAHDVRIGNQCVIANVGTLGGHVAIGDRVIIGGLAAIHQFVRIGSVAIIGGCSKVVQDIPPYSTCDGHPACVRGLNIEGLKRAGMSPAVRAALKKAFKILFFSKLAFSHAAERIQDEVELLPEVSFLLDFFKDSKRGICG
ncbi:MAG: acyl-ACP--UDP-N-acetylglucosamine O-acyltransferase [Candidatus Omnitrophica bacterium]|nr:acyl-ACP--UDP-N-acetylglucosamine O-acyltransferase [Candidatus Omnitrophota bacterium]